MPIEIRVQFRERVVNFEVFLWPDRAWRLALLLVRFVTSTAHEILPDDESSSTVLNKDVMHRRELLQTSSSGDGQDAPEPPTATGNVVALIVIVSVAILFVFKICLCMVRVSRAEREAQQAEIAAVQSRLRARRLAPPPLPVLFVNPAGSLRIGKNSKGQADPDLSSYRGGSQNSRDLYLFGEADLEEAQVQRISISPVSSHSTENVPLLHDSTQERLV